MSVRAVGGNIPSMHVLNIHLEAESVRISSFCVAVSAGSLWAQVSSLCSQAADSSVSSSANWRTALVVCLFTPWAWTCHAPALSQHSSASSPSAPGQWCKCTSCSSRASRHPAGGAGPFPGHQPAHSQPKPSRQPWWDPPFSYFPVWESQGAILLQAQDLFISRARLKGSKTPYGLLIVRTWQGLCKGAGLGRTPAAARESGQEESRTLLGKWRRFCCWSCLGSALPTTLTMWATCTSCTQNCESPGNCLPGLVCRGCWGWDLSQFPASMCV